MRVLLKCTQHTTYTQDSRGAHNSVKCRSPQTWSAKATCTDTHTHTHTSL